MARRKKSSLPMNATDVANIAKSNPYIQQILNDAKLRKSVQTAVTSYKKAYGRVSNGKVNPQKLLEDKKLHADVARGLGASRDAAIIVVNVSRKPRRGRKRTSKVMIVVIGGGVALAASEKLRSKLLDLLFGAEEEFQYTPPVNSASSESTTTVGGAA
ncbi:MAG TPA: hypothetical protein VGF81_02500 [Solirubrobacteraceae bacterium]